MSLDLNQIIPSVVRSLTVGAVAVPLALSISGTLNAGSTFLRAQAEVATSGNTRTVTQNNIKNDLTETCIDYLLSTNDSKAERASMDEIDEYFGNEMNHREVCRWVYG